ncbi:RNA methyltransferase, putative [Plasmodium gallinaceum]|uniref:16S rRNA (uracil(1498)-N(3))-methyltransferase n=1 Tax=Plasmodium gallinaceum TaxID=5849 RepID=A0A1J1GN01_PLAGA|nr:RNA methyltransferase, putative [Plasmodium gallinaceum]CRG93801.1 RNA methyltransferase, putative [Plasmodium gallinaceum]
MNLILISSKCIYEINNEFFFRTDDRQTNHLKSILKVQLNQHVKVGVINKGKGEGIIIEENKNYYVIKLLSPIHLEKPESRFIPIDVVICIPRPKILNKMLQQLSSVGVKKIIIVFSEYSNKSYESSKIFRNEEIKYALQLGLEQAMCTQFPETYIHYSFNSFFMNIQKYADDNTIKLCAHTDIKTNTTSNEFSILNKEEGKILLMLGCERGFSDLEIYLIKKLGFNFLYLTERILKCETAILIIIGQLLLLTENTYLRPNGKKMRRYSKDRNGYIEKNIMKSKNKEEIIENNYNFQDKTEIIHEIKDILVNETFSSEQLKTYISNFIKEHESMKDFENIFSSNEDNVLKQKTNIIDEILKNISSFNKNDENNFENIYLSLLLKKIKYKNRFCLSYNDVKNNVDDDGVFIYRTQRYITKKKKNLLNDLHST